MFKKIALGLATALAVTLAAGSLTTTAQAAEFSFTIGNGHPGPVRAVHDRRHGPRDFRDGNWRERRGGWRGDRRGGKRRHAGRHDRRQVCHVVKKFITVYDDRGRPHRRVKRREFCEWVRR